MAKLINSCTGIVILLLFSSTVSAALYLTKLVDASNNVSVYGAIEVYGLDGSSPLTSYCFPLFTGGTAETFLKGFFINNTGSQTVSVYWNVTSSSVSWQVRATPFPDMYDCYEDNIRKYSFGIRQDSMASADYWSPEGETVLLGVGTGIRLQFELYYTGEPNTAETFTMAISFCAKQPSTINAAINFMPDTLSLKSRGRWVACSIELPEGYDVKNIDFSSIKLNDTIAVDLSAPILVDDYDHDGITDLSIKFGRSCIIEWLRSVDYFKDPSNKFEITFKVTGEITEAIFEGIGTVRVTHNLE